MFEMGARPHAPRALYRAYLEQSDVFIGVYWQQYGWIAPDMQISGLEDEYLLSDGMPRLIYLKRPAPDIEPALSGLLRRLKSEDAVSYRPFSTTEELQALVADDLALMLTVRFTLPTLEAERGTVMATAPPSPMTRLVGRDQEVDRVVDLLGKGTRLVTLTGVGGIGKTRLATAVVERLGQDAGEPTAFIDLSTVTDAVLVPAVIARSVGVAVQGNARPLDGVVGRLQAWSGTLPLPPRARETPTRSIGTGPPQASALAGFDVGWRSTNHLFHGRPIDQVARAMSRPLASMERSI